MIKLREYTPSIWPVGEEDLSYLISMVRHSPTGEGEIKVLQSITPTTKRGFWQLTPGPYVGRLGLPSGNWIDFQSRFEFPDVIQLIQLSAWPPVLVNEYPVPATPGLMLIDAIASAFNREVGRLVGQGLSKAYHGKRQTRPPYGGRIDVGFHITRFAGRPDVLVTEKRVLTVDIMINRALAAALEVLHRIPLSQEIARQLTHLRPAFTRISGRGVTSADIPRIHLQGEAIRYARALALAEAILRSQDLIPTGSGIIGSSLLFHMPRVWERYVARWVSTTTEETVEAQYPFRLTNEGLSAQADVVVRSGRTIQAVFDAKYKLAGVTPDNQDIYQMVTYCQALNLDEATLVYPGHIKPKTVTVRGKTVHMRGLELDLSDVTREVAA